MKIFTVAFPDEFDPIAEQIEQLSNEFDQSKSCTIRDILCEFFDFTPEREPRRYEKRSKKVC